MCGVEWGKAQGVITTIRNPAYFPPSRTLHIPYIVQHSHHVQGSTNPRPNRARAASTALPIARPGRRRRGLLFWPGWSRPDHGQIGGREHPEPNGGHQFNPPTGRMLTPAATNPPQPRCRPRGRRVQPPRRDQGQHFPDRHGRFPRCE